MKFSYRAFDKSGKPTEGAIEADSSARATETLRRKGLFITEISEGGAPGDQTGGARVRMGRSVKLKDLAMFTRQLYVLLSAGTQVVEALAALERQIRDEAWKSIITDLRVRVEEGAPLAEAMEAHPGHFDSIYRSLVAAGESSGKLTLMLDRLGTLTQKRLKVRNTVIGAMIYPSLLITVAIGVLALLLVFVVPKFRTLFETLDVPLPTSTKALVFISEQFRSYWWLVIALLVATGAGWKIYLGTDSGQRKRDTILLRLPQLGKVVKSFATARITRLLGVLMDGHVPLIEALKLTRAAAGNVHYRELIARAEEHVIRGEPLSLGLSETDLISPSVYEAVRSGEQSGQVAPLLLNIADFLDEDNDVVIRSLTSIIEPVILIVMGALVGLVAISMFMPLFDLTSMTQGGA